MKVFIVTVQDPDTHPEGAERLVAWMARNGVILDAVDTLDAVAALELWNERNPSIPGESVQEMVLAAR